MRSAVIKVLCVMLTVCSIGACARKGGVEVEKKAPDFTLPNLAGREVSLSDFKGKVIILDFFANWCPPCRAEIPGFVALQEEYGPEGFTVVGVSLTPMDETRDFAIGMNINYPVVVDDGTAASLFGPIRSIPMTFLIGRDMRIAKVYIGYRSKDVFEDDLKKLLGK